MVYSHGMNQLYAIIADYVVNQMIEAFPQKKFVYN